MNAELVLKNSLSETDKIPAFLESQKGDFLLTQDLVFQINLALEELVVNIIDYGYQDDEEHEIHITLQQAQGTLVIVIEDDGAPFNPLTASEPDLDVSLEEREIGGLGIYLVRKLFDRMSYERRDTRNIVRLEKDLSL